MKEGWSSDKRHSLRNRQFHFASYWNCWSTNKTAKIFAELPFQQQLKVSSSWRKEDCLGFTVLKTSCSRWHCIRFFQLVMPVGIGDFVTLEMILLGLLIHKEYESGPNQTDNAREWLIRKHFFCIFTVYKLIQQKFS